MSRALQYKKLEGHKRRLAIFSIMVIVFYLSTVVIGGIAYAYSNMSASMEIALRYSLFISYSILVFLSFIALVTSALLIFLAKSSTAMGEFPSAKKLTYSAIVTTIAAVAFTTSALVISGGIFATELFYVYIVLQSIALALSIYLLTSLRSVVSYYTPRRK